MEEPIISREEATATILIDILELLRDAHGEEEEPDS